MPTPPESSSPISAQAKELCADPKFQRYMGASDAESARKALLVRAGVGEMSQLKRDTFDLIVSGYASGKAE